SSPVRGKSGSDTSGAVQVIRPSSHQGYAQRAKLCVAHMELRGFNSRALPMGTSPSTPLWADDQVLTRRVPQADDVAPQLVVPAMSHHVGSRGRTSLTPTARAV